MSSISHVRKKAPRARTDSGLKPLETFVSSGVFTQIRQHHDWLQALHTAWQQHAGLPLASHTRPVSYRAGRLLVHADSSIWADRVRQQHQRLMQALRQHSLLDGLMQVSVRVAPREGAPQPVTRQGGARLSTASATLINTAATSIDDPDLRAALQRLGSRAEQKR
jgi:hypothetical protein